MWDLSCSDWEDRIREGRSLIPDLPLIESEAELGLRFFDELQLPDVPEQPKLGAPDFAAGPWFRDIVRAAFGSWDPCSKHRLIRDILTLAPKGQSKTSYSAALMIVAMLMNRRPRAEALFVGPTQAIADRAYDQAAGMIEASPLLKRRFKPIDHRKTIEDLVNHSEMKVRTFALDILTGSILIFVLLDELHLLGHNPYTTKVLRQIRGGLDKTPEGLLLMTTTMPDHPPTGAFRDELIMARKIRDGKFRGKVIRPMLPILYELPADIAKDPAKWQDPSYWPMVMPNLGRSAHLENLVPDWESEKSKGEHAIKIWASQHLNIEIGIGFKTDGWPGAEFWIEAQDETIDLDLLLERCETIVVGVDGGGLDDLFGLALLGRERETKRWLSWSHAWCHKGVLQRRQLMLADNRIALNAGWDLEMLHLELRDLSSLGANLSTLGFSEDELAAALAPAGSGAPTRMRSPNFLTLLSRRWAISAARCATTSARTGVAPGLCSLVTSPMCGTVPCMPPPWRRAWSPMSSRSGPRSFGRRSGWSWAVVTTTGSTSPAGMRCARKATGPATASRRRFGPFQAAARTLKPSTAPKSRSSACGVRS